MSRNVLLASFLGSVALAIGCGDGSDTGDDSCPAGQIREGGRCVPSGGNDTVPGCTDSDAANYAAAANSDDGSCVYDVRFQVDLSAQTLAGSDVVYVRGDFNSFAGTADALADPDQDGIWTAVLALAPATYEYKYTINDVDNGGIDETVPAACDPDAADGVDTRGFQVVDAPLDLPLHAFGACPSAGSPGCTDADASNYDPAATTDDGSCEYDVTFNVDMGCSGETFTTVLISGPFCSWCDSGYALADSDGDGIWTATFQFAPGDIEFTYMVDNFASQEDLVDDMAGGATCAPSTDYSSYANRQITVLDAPLTSDDVYGRCDACPSGAALDVFTDDYAAGVTFAGFGGATNALAVDTAVAYAGSASLRVDVPAAGYTGGALVSAAPADLTGYDAVTFWVRASTDATLNVAGLGNNASTNIYQAELGAIPLSTSWTQVIIPIPLASKLTAEAGLFHFAEGSDEGEYSIWLDEIRYDLLGSAVVGPPSAAMATETLSLQVGDNFGINGTVAIFEVNSVQRTITAGPAYFSYASTDELVATVDALAVGSAVGVGAADITAELGGVAAAGTLTVNVSAASVPGTSAPTPTQDAANVISLFSDAYTDVSVDTWSAGWDNADVADDVVGTDNVKLYTNLVFAGVEFTSAPIDATSMTTLHIDIWAPLGDTFRIKLVDFGADGAYGGGDDTEHEITVTPVTNSTWVSLDLALDDFTALAARAHLAQMILSGNTSTVYVDNVYFYF